MNVKILKGAKILSSTALEDGQTEIALSNGTKFTVDLYLPTMGVIPNSEYVPQNLLDDKSLVTVDEFLRVKGTQDFWAAGDTTDLDFAQLIYCEKQAPAVAKYLDLVLKGKEPVVFKSAGAGGDRTIGILLGPSKDTGRLGSMKIPSLVIW